MSPENETDEMRSEYDIRGGVRGKYFTRYVGGRVTIRTSPPDIRVETAPSTASIGVHAPESTFRVIPQAVYQPPNPATR